MSERLQITHKEKIGSTTITYRADILDSEFSGTAEEKVVSDVFFGWEYDKIDERNPFENPVQKSSFDCNLLVQSSSDLTLLTDIIDADEDRFQIKFYVDGTHKWTGNVLTDLLEYSEGPYPFTAKITAKDLSVLETKPTPLDDSIITNRSRLSEIIADCLKETGLTFPIRSYTNITNDEFDLPSEDFLFNVWHYNNAFTGSNGEMVSCMESLQAICAAYNLIIYQSGVRWIIDQLPAVAKGDSDQWDYNSDGLNPSSSTPDRTVTIDRRDSFLLPTSRNIVIGALKEITSDYNHRTLINNIPAEDVDYIGDPTPTEILNNGTFELSYDQHGALFAFSGETQVEAELSASNPGGSIIEAYFEVITGDDASYMDASGNFSSSQQQITITLSGSGTTVSGSFSIEESDGIGGEGVVKVRFLGAEMVDDVGSGVTVDETHWAGISFFIYNTALKIRDNSATTSHQYRRTGNYSVTEELPVTFLGDGPTQRSVGATTHSSTGLSSVMINDSWMLRGESSGVSLEELRGRERASMRRGSLRSLRAALWMKFEPEQIISYNSESWYFLGGRFQARQSRWDANIMKLAYSRDDASDTYSVFTESGGSPSGASGTGGPGGGGGLSVSEADNRYFKQASNLSEGTPATIRSNVGLTDQTADLDLNSISVNGTNLFPSNDPQALGVSDSPTLAGLTLTGALTGTSADFSGSLDASTLRPDTGKFLSPVSYAFRNAGDTNYRDVQMADLTAVAGTFSSTLTANGEIDVNDDITIDDATILSTNTFLSGFAGSGLQLERDALGHWKLTIDEIVARRRITAYELYLDQLRGGRGSEIFRSGMEVFDIEEKPAYRAWEDVTEAWEDCDWLWGVSHEIYQEEDILIPLVEGDLIRQQNFTGRNIKLVEATVLDVENGDPDPTINTTDRFASISVQKGSDDPEIGDQFVSYGNESDPNRQGFYGIFGEGDGAPYARIMNGITSREEFGSMDTLVAQLGRLDNITDPDFSDLDGTQENLYGVLTDRFYAKDNVNISLSGGGMKIGKNADGSGNYGIYQDENNYWLPEVGFKITISGGFVTADEIISTINASTEGIDITGDRIQLTGDTSIAGSFEVTGSNISLTGADITLNGDTTVQGSFGVTGTNITLDGDVTIDGTFELNGNALVDGSITAAKIDVNDLFAQNITITGQIADSGSNFTIDSDGMSVSTNSVFIQSAAFTVESSGTAIGKYWGNAADITLESEVDLNLIASTELFLESTNDSVWVSGLGGSVFLQASDRVKMQSNVPFQLALLSDTQRNALSPDAGDAIFNTTDNRLQIYDGTQWQRYTWS